MTDETPDDGREHINHKQACPGPEIVHEVGRMGDTLTRCANCRRFHINKDTPTSVETVRAPVGKYVCREHWQPVNARGKGCTACARGRGH